MVNRWIGVADEMPVLTPDEPRAPAQDIRAMAARTVLDNDAPRGTARSATPHGMPANSTTLSEEWRAQHQGVLYRSQYITGR